uniref:Uncharacterized protein n=1 Tax=Oryza nivara TaxID=4536 RepID=A0A0E0HFQ3_ORYNI
MTAALQALLDPTALSLGLPTPVINKEEYLAICLTVLAGTRAGKALVGKAVLGAGVNDALPLSLVRSCRLTPSPPDTCHTPDLILSGPPCWWEWETSRRCSHVGLQAVVPEVASGGAHGTAVDWRPPSATLSADLLPSSPPPARAAPPMLTCATSSLASLPRTPPPVSAPTRRHRRESCKVARTTQPPPTTMKMACSEFREEREEERRGRERLACFRGILRCGAHVGPSLTQPPRRINPESKPPMDLVCTVVDPKSRTRAKPPTGPCTPASAAAAWAVRMPCRLAA